MVRSDLCDFSDAYIVVKGTITLTKDTDREFTDVRNKSLAFKNNVPFTNSISKINNVLIENAEDVDDVMLMYNLIDTVKAIEKQQIVYGIFTEMSLIIFLPPIIMQTPCQILNHLNTKHVLQGNIKCKSRKR